MLLVFGHLIIGLSSPVLPPSNSASLSMAMSLQIPSSPSDGASTSSSTHPPSPLTPPPIPQSLSDVNDSNSATTLPAPVGKRKPSRRANTAERRATHNAVERQRRETLNGRFLVRTYHSLKRVCSPHRSRISPVFYQTCLKSVAPQSLRL